MIVVDVVLLLKARRHADTITKIIDNLYLINELMNYFIIL